MSGARPQAGPGTPATGESASWPLAGQVDDSGCTEIADLDRNGTIIRVNEAWVRFCLANGGDPERAGPGVSWLAACDAAGTDPWAVVVCEAVRLATDGRVRTPLTVTAPCHGTTGPRWFDIGVSSRYGDDGEPVGARVTVAPRHADGVVVPDQEPPGTDSVDGTASPPPLSLFTEILDDLLAAPEEQAPLLAVLAVARRLTGASRAAVLVPAWDGDHGPTGVEVRASLGEDADGWAHGIARLDGPVGHVVATSEPISANGDAGGTLLAVPLLVPNGTGGAVLVAGPPGASTTGDGPASTPLATLETVAGQAALALALRSGELTREDVRARADRDRIAADLHDTVVRRLFSAGMTLEGVVGSLEPAARDRVLASVELLDAAIRDIRDAVLHGWQQRPGPPPH